MVNNSYDRFRHRLADLRIAESKGMIADSMEVRIALIKRMEAGEITLEQMQAELAAIKRGAKAKGLKTRSEAF